MEYAFPTFASYLVQLPVFLVWLVGLVLSIVFWKRHPRVSLLALIALAGLLVTTAINIFLNLWLPLALERYGLGLSQVGVVFMANTIIDSVIYAVLWGLILAAIFGWRRQPQPSAA